MYSITLWEFVALAAAAMLVGFSKTAVSGANTVSLAVFAAVLPARESTGILLPVLIAGDVLAVLTYRRHAHWPTLGGCSPPWPGSGRRVVFMIWADDTAVRLSIGAILLFMAAVTVWRRRGAPPRRSPGGGPWHTRPTAQGRFVRVLGGFTTMVANAGGPVMSMYLLSAGFRKLGFLGTSAWFFLIVNCAKVPFSVGLGLIDGRSLLLDAVLLAFVVPGAFLGKAIVHRIHQRLFERLVIAATVLGGAQLLLR
ncbi:sulfite exporter TauE/SafE family protein [Streptomyces sp. M19]